ncbi:MAG TPA: GGDEF domain-containing protein [Modestobacter sp.]|jgi:diguanylate cyclase (GGDEF)-like protein|nr:GGDEF domain-containing protein [Modestobacter sp.]
MEKTGMFRSRPPQVALLAVLHALAGVLCLASALRPMSEAAPVELAWVLGGVGLAVAAVLWLIGPRVPAATHGALAVFSVCAGALAWQSATAVGIVGLGPVLLAVGLYAAHFFSLGAARAHAVLVIGLTSLGALAAEPTGFLVPWLIAALTAGIVTEAQGRLSARLRSAASTDPLTGLANRRAWAAAATPILAHAHRSGEPLTIALLDLDGFKQVNDTEGHHAGDELLRRLTALWSSRLRGADLLGRHGGDEFVLCLPATDGPGAVDVLDRLTDGAPATWSVGTATAGDGDTLTALLARADAALYRDKLQRRESGRS